MQASLKSEKTLSMNTTELAKLCIVHYPDPVLKKVCAPVEVFDAKLKRLADRMLELMHQGRGIGLAAPQVGVLSRILVSNPTGEAEDDLICVNPRLVELTGAEDGEEGCLSIPGVIVTKRRAARVVMEAFDTDGKPFAVAGEDLRARVWQHEFDHLEGRLLTDHMSTADEIANRRAVKQLKEEYATVRRR